MEQILWLLVVMVIGALSAVSVGGLIELARAFLDADRRHAILGRSFAQNVRQMLS